MVSAEVEFTLIRSGKTVPYRTIGIDAKNKDEFDSILASNIKEIELKFGVPTSHRIKNFRDDTPKEKEDADLFFDYTEDKPTRSTDFNYAKDAIEFIDNNDVDESFIEGEERITVERAFNNKTK